jgi:hypothetical protein
MPDYIIDIGEMIYILQNLCIVINESKRFIKISHNKLKEFLDSINNQTIQEMLKIHFDGCKHDLILSKDFVQEYDDLFEIEWNDRMDVLKKKTIQCLIILFGCKNDFEIIWPEKEEFLYELPDVKIVCILDEYLNSIPILRFVENSNGVKRFKPNSSLTFQHIPNVIRIHNTINW